MTTRTTETQTWLMSFEDEDRYYSGITNVRTCNIYYPTGFHLRVITYTL